MELLKIPDAAVPALQKIAAMPEEVFGSLTAILRQTKPLLSSSAFIAKVGSQIKGLDPADFAVILGVIYSLYKVKDAKRRSSQEVADAVSEAMAKKPSFGFPEKLSILSIRIKELLEFDTSVAVSFKAADVMTAHEHVFCNARILSDIRPVFADSMEVPGAAVIVHNLKIGFHNKTDGKHVEFYVALDVDDIRELKEIVERAEQKTAALKAVIAKSELLYLEP
jgi:hypothetical protein